jgi:hypothetical protein
MRNRSARKRKTGARRIGRRNVLANATKSLVGISQRITRNLTNANAVNRQEEMGQQDREWRVKKSKVRRAKERMQVTVLRMKGSSLRLIPVQQRAKRWEPKQRRFLLTALVARPMLVLSSKYYHPLNLPNERRIKGRRTRTE